MLARMRVLGRLAIVRSLLALGLLALSLLAVLVLEVWGAPRAARLAFDRDGHARIPFDLRSGHVWVRGTVNGSDSVWIVVDTGASSSVLDQGLATKLSLRAASGEAKAMGAGGPQSSTPYHDVTIHLASLSVHRRTMPAIDLAGVTQQGGRPMQAVLGYDLFQSCVVRFDYGAGWMDVWESGRAPRDLPGEAVPMTLENNHPYVEGTLSLPGREPLRGRFVIDTGSSMALLIAPEIAERESLASAFPRTIVQIGRGVGGELRSSVGRAESFAIGDLNFSQPTVVMPNPDAGRISAIGSIGNIGGQILNRCRVTFDYARKQVHFEPAGGFERRFEADMSGAAVTRNADGFEVRHVDPDSPAGEAGLQVGVVVTGVDGQPATTLDPAALRLQMQQEGRVVRLSVKRGSDSRDVTLTLRRLI